MTRTLLLTAVPGAFCGTVEAQPGDPGKVFPAEFQEVPNPGNGVKIVQWTRDGSSHQWAER